ncbi:hypothetical protein [Halalkalibacter hemicellulosilyticus]|uniref:Helix-turn-helix domain-containing protein n=1 Tax=Halalkalibacter hemicellulosilyticusJCM 9152 TaxID=1236971 RepID=W4QK25_9BACI|nr:hypothetical protein [Halalkalibacter hemicellulosilyticus]GAE32460.1 hypothetical protein JCM9152_3995 [Halalkalibacter hemicellulosilyticusJCM 9152]
MHHFSNEKELIDFLEKELVSVTEAAEILELTTRRVNRLEKDGKLRAVKEKPKLFLRSAVERKKKELEELRKKYRPYD